jgi:hypothetical protein
MLAIAVITQRAVIDKILDHVGLSLVGIDPEPDQRAQAREADGFARASISDSSLDDDSKAPGKVPFILHDDAKAAGRIFFVSQGRATRSRQQFFRPRRRRESCGEDFFVFEDATAASRSL